MRDRLIALGMRRPTRINSEDCDIPMLAVEDFEIKALSAENVLTSMSCTLMQDTRMQKELADMCVAKAKLCVCVGHVLSAQDSVLLTARGAKLSDERDMRLHTVLSSERPTHKEVFNRCDTELAEWIENLPAAYTNGTPTWEDIIQGKATLAVQRALLHMVYHATVWTLHRAQASTSQQSPTLERCHNLQGVSRQKVREAVTSITAMSVGLHKLELVRYLPTTSVTALLPAIIMHLVDINSGSENIKWGALEGFYHCMKALEQLRDNYAAADYATRFLEAAICKRGTELGMNNHNKINGLVPHERPRVKQQPLKDIAQNVSYYGGARSAGGLSSTLEKRAYASPLCPFPETISSTIQNIVPAETPPSSDFHCHHNNSTQTPAFELDEMMNLDGIESEAGLDGLMSIGMDGDWTSPLDRTIPSTSGELTAITDWLNEGGY